MNKFDLCANTVTIDYDELVKTAQIAVRFSFDQLHRELDRWHDLNKPPTRNNADWMKQSADALATATTTLYYLREGKDRNIKQFAEANNE